MAIGAWLEYSKVVIGEEPNAEEKAGNKRQNGGGFGLDQYSEENVWQPGPKFNVL